MWLAHTTPTCRQPKHYGSVHFPLLTLLHACASQNHQKPIKLLAPGMSNRRMKLCCALAEPDGLLESVYGFIDRLVETPSGSLMNVRIYPSTKLGRQRGEWMNTGRTNPFPLH